MPWLALTGIAIVAVGGLDFLTGEELGFFVFYFLPVTLAAWRFGFPAAVGASLLSAVAWLVADLGDGPAVTIPGLSVWNTLIRLAAFLAIGWTTARIQSLLDHERRLSAELTAALNEVRTLKGLLPVCAWCSKIQDDDGSWLALDTYVGRHTEAQVSHGICDACAQTMLEQEGASPR